MPRIKFSLQKFFYFLACMAVVNISFVAPSHALTRTVTLTATPAIIDTGGTPDSETTFSFQIKNDADVVLPIRIVARDALVKDGQTAEEVRAMSARNWVSFTQPDFVLQGNEAKFIEGTLKIPQDASPGGHYADVVVSPLSLETDEDIVAAQPELIVQMLITVPGEVREELHSTLKSPGTVILSKSAEKDILFEVKNHGNIHTLFQPKVYIRQDGEDVTTIDMKPQIILPKESRVLHFLLLPISYRHLPSANGIHLWLASKYPCQPRGTDLQTSC